MMKLTAEIKKLCNEKYISLDNGEGCPIEEAYTYAEIDRILILKSEGKEQFDHCVQLLRDTNNLGQSLTTKSIRKFFVIYLVKNNLDKERINDDSVKQFIKEIQLQPEREYIGWHRIQGIGSRTDKKLKIGKFEVIVGKELLLSEIEEHTKECSQDLRTVLKDKITQGNEWIITRAYAREAEKAQEKVYEEMEIFQNMLRIVGWMINPDFRINILDYEDTYYDECLMICKPIEGGFFSKLNGHTPKLEIAQIEFFEKEFLEKMETICEKKEQSKWDNAILRGIGFLGRAIIEGPTAIGFLQGMIAIECLTTYSEETMISPGVSAQICENCAFLLGDNREERVKISSDLKKLYKTRSAITHGGKDSMVKKSYYEILEYSAKIIKKICTDIKFSDWRSMEDLREFIQNEKYK